MKNKLFFLKVVLVFMLGISQSINAEMIKLKKSEYMAPTRLGNFKVYHEGNTFYVEKDNQLYKVDQYHVDKDIRNISTTKDLGFLGRNNPQYQVISFENFQALKSMNKYKFIEIDDEEKKALFIELNNLHKNSGYLTINQSNSGQYSIRAMVRLRGGGIIGGTAGAYLGKFMVHFIAHGTILIIGGLTGFAAPATIASLEATLLPTIEAASVIVALAGGITGSVITGPV